MGFLLRNWHLKLSAVLLATVLYTGLVFSGSFSERTIQVRVEQDNAPRDSFVLSGDLGFVEVTYRTANDLAASVVAEAFVGRVDLAEYDMNRAPEPQVLNVSVSALTEGVEVLSVSPETVRVEIDRIEVRTVPVEVETGAVPDGLEIDEPALSTEEVEVRGPASFVDQVDRAVAFVSISASGIAFNEPVDLVAVDVEGQPVDAGRVEIEPETVSVQVDVQETQTNKTVPVRPDIGGTPAPGFALESLTVEPSVVTLRGLPGDLAEIAEVLTEPLSLDGASTDQSFDAALVLGPDVRLADATAEDVVTVNATIVPSVSSRTFVVGIACEGAGDNACLPAIDQLTVTLSGPGGTLSALSAGALTPTLDASGLEPGTYELEPSLGALPDGVELLGISPGAVSVTIRAPASPTPTPAP
ncbi:MAG TPA: CdaR family protein [Candidatus Limnocylindrales bacterium]|nr:CdaR family protein [Candidatus Limnocylindrales bacterium]